MATAGNSASSRRKGSSARRFSIIAILPQRRRIAM
jgi:hypothetical protein